MSDNILTLLAFIFIVIQPIILSAWAQASFIRRRKVFIRVACLAFWWVICYTSQAAQLLGNHHLECFV